MKNNENKITEGLQMVLDSSSVAFSAVGLVQPAFAPLAPICNLLSLPFAAHNQSLMRKQINLLVDEFNMLHTRVDKLEQLDEEKSRILTLNEYKLFDYCLREKMKEKIKLYAKIFSEGINSESVFEQDDLFDIQMDIINSLKLEDIKLCIYLIDYTKQNTDAPLAYEFSKESLEAYIVKSSNEEDTLNKYALRHLINLGLIDERYMTSAQINNGHTLVFNDSVEPVFSLTQRFRMIYEVVFSAHH